MKNEQRAGACLQSIPTLEELLEAIGQRFTFGLADGRTVQAVLAHASAGTPMNDSFVCYAATFELPSGVFLPQNVYRIGSPAGRAWDLLATPTRPTADGRSTLTVVIHTRADELANAAGSSEVM
ncbi:MAG TPA: hypothetical protein VHC91_05570 [Trinickia sp.]|jgi:hypothetical protein|nr:hypothetical protein [Trinickia sp.]